MTPERPIPLTPRIETAIDELKGLIATRYLDATFAVGEGDDPDGIYLTATVDVEAMDEVVDVFLARMVALQVEEELPLFVVAVRPTARNAALLAQRQMPAAMALPLP